MSLRDALGPLLDDLGAAGVFTDFDGTLAPIVDDPATSRPLEGVVEALGDLAPRVARLGVISGRPASFLLEQLKDPSLSMWGLYGLEKVELDEAGKPRVVPTPEAEEWRDRVDEVSARAERELAEKVGVERKGLTLTLHFRTAPERETEVREWADEAAAATGLDMHPGRMSYELRPPVAGDKGTVLEEAASGLAAVCFFGDDTGDLHAFDALDRLAERGAATVRIGVRSEEAPQEVLDRADVVAEGPSGVLEALRLLAGH